MAIREQSAAEPSIGVAEHGPHSHVHHDRSVGKAAPFALRPSWFLMAAVERLIFAVVMSGLIWIGIVWAVG